MIRRRRGSKGRGILGLRVGSWSLSGRLSTIRGPHGITWQVKWVICANESYDLGKWTNRETQEISVARKGGICGKTLLLGSRSTLLCWRLRHCQGSIRKVQPRVAEQPGLSFTWLTNCVILLGAAFNTSTFRSIQLYWRLCAIHSASMAESIYPEYPPELSKARHQFLLSNLKDWSIAHGLAVRPATAFVPSKQDPELSLATTAPVTLFPSLFPKSCFEQGLAIQTTYNKLYAAIASDEDWLKPIIEECVNLPLNKSPEFHWTSRLWCIWSLFSFYSADIS